MKRSKQNIIIEQMDKKLLPFQSLRDAKRPANGWVHEIRLAMKISLRQLGQKLSISAQSVKELETREKYGTVTIETLRKAGQALNMRLVYGFIPQDASINEMIAARAREVATRIVKRTSISMKLGGQENSGERIERAIDELTEELKREMPRYLWD